MLDPGDLRAKPDTDLVIAQARIPSPELNRYLYTAVGGDWFWLDRLGWTYDDWYRYLNREEQQTWVGYADGTPAGYFELEKQDAGNVEIAYFGLMSNFMGKGYGGHLLSDTELGNRDLATKLQFGPQVGVGLGFGQKGNYELTYRYQYLTNGGIKQPNDGLKMHFLSFGYAFR